MNTESFCFPISSPYHRIWVDRNIKGMPQVDIIPDITSFMDVFIGTSIKENYIRIYLGFSHGLHRNSKKLL